MKRIFLVLFACCQEEPIPEAPIAIVEAVEEANERREDLERGLSAGPGVPCGSTSPWTLEVALGERLAATCDAEPRNAMMRVLSIEGAAGEASETDLDRRVSIVRDRRNGETCEIELDVFAELENAVVRLSATVERDIVSGTLKYTSDHIPASCAYGWQVRGTRTPGHTAW